MKKKDEGFKVPFAFDEGNLIGVDDATKGVVYHCSCGSEVSVRGGKVISNHFYHLTESNCSLESAIHKAYKEVFKKVKKIKLPYSINGSNYLEFDDVILEKKIDDYIPDAIGIKGGEKYLIEFAKSSYIGERKYKKIKKSNLFCIEIDIIKTVYTLEDIENHLLCESSYKHIIHIPEYKEMAEMREKFESAYYKIKNENSDLKWKMKKYEENRDEFFIDWIKENRVFLFHNKECRNGAQLYEKRLSNGEKLICFVDKKRVSLMINEF